MGSLVIVKATVDNVPKLLIQNLTTEQVIQLGRTPELKNNPLKLLGLLEDSKIDSSIRPL